MPDDDVPDPTFEQLNQFQARGNCDGCGVRGLLWFTARRVGDHPTILWLCQFCGDLEAEGRLETVRCAHD